MGSVNGDGGAAGQMLGGTITQDGELAVGAADAIRRSESPQR